MLTSKIVIELTEDQVSTLLYEIGEHATTLNIYAIGKPIPIVKQVFARCDALKPIHDILFRGLEDHHAIEKQLGDYDEDTTTLPGTSD